MVARIIVETSYQKGSVVYSKLKDSGFRPEFVRVGCLGFDVEIGRNPISDASKILRIPEVATVMLEVRLR